MEVMVKNISKLTVNFRCACVSILDPRIRSSSFTDDGKGAHGTTNTQKLPLRAPSGGRVSGLSSRGHVRRRVSGLSARDVASSAAKLAMAIAPCGSSVAMADAGGVLASSSSLSTRNSDCGRTRCSKVVASLPRNSWLPGGVRAVKERRVDVHRARGQAPPPRGSGGRVCGRRRSPRAACPPRQQHFLARTLEVCKRSSARANSRELRLWDLWRVVCSGCAASCAVVSLSLSLSLALSLALALTLSQAAL